MMGRRYVLDYCISSFKKKQKDFLFKIYVTDALKAIAYNSSHSEEAIELNNRYFDWINPPKEETRTSKEVIDDIRKKLRGH